MKMRKKAFGLKKKDPLDMSWKSMDIMDVFVYERMQKVFKEHMAFDLFLETIFWVSWR